MHWSTWNELCKPKSKGGMGFRKLTLFNQALLAKQVWRMIRFPNSIVSRIFKAKYFSNDDIMEVNLANNSSFVWRSILWGRDLLKEGLRWKVGDGETIRVFHDAWLHHTPNGRILRQPAGLENLRVADLIDDNMQWDKEKMEEVLQPNEMIDVMKGEQPKVNVSDHRFWRFDPRGEYSVKSGYLAASNYFAPPISSSENGYTGWWKFIWSFDLPPRLRIFSWRVFRNFIPTEMNLHKHHVPVFGRCGWCRKGWGTTSHVLLYCEKIRQKWKGFKFWHILKSWEAWDIGVIGEVMRKEISREEFEKWLTGMWLIWKWLCDEKHKNIKLRDCDLQTECEVLIEGYAEAKQQAACQSRVLPREGRNKWRRPGRGRFRLDVDYAADEEGGKGGVGAIVRDDKGQIVFALAKPTQLSVSSLHGELKALMHGICCCIEENISPVEAYTDSMMAVVFIAEGEESKSVLCEDMFDFFSTVKELNVISINHVRREANIAAHELASLAKSIETTVLWRDSWPAWLSDIVREDLF